MRAAHPPGPLASGRASGTTPTVSRGPSHPGTSYWLEERRSEWPSARFAGRADVAVIGGGVTGCSCALTLASKRRARAPARSARDRRRSERAQRRLRPPRRDRVPYDRARAELGAEPARRLMALTERALDRMEELAGDAFRRVGSLRLAADAAERDALRREHDALRDDGFAVEWVDELPPPLDRALRRRDPASARRGAPAGALGAPARGARRGGGRGHPRARSGRRSTSSTPTSSSSRATASPRRCCPSSRAVVRPTRGQVLATEPLPSCSTRGRTTRATATTTGSSCRTAGS